MICPIGPSRRLWLNQCTQSSMASSIYSRLRHDLRWITLALYSLLIVLARALSYVSPTLPTDDSIRASACRSPWQILTYCVPSVGVVDQLTVPLPGVQDLPAHRV